MSILNRAPRRIWGFLDVINRAVRKNPDKIFIYSNLGFRDNVRAVYDHLIENGYNEKYEIVCSINDFERYKHNAPENVKFVGNIWGLFHFFQSRHCFYCFGKYPVKPARDQNVINLWHGMPLKRVGNMEPQNRGIDYNYFTKVLCTSEFFRDIMKQSFNATDDQILMCGQPRTDIMVRETPEYSKASVTARFFGEDNRHRKLMLWLPTFRQDGTGELDIMPADLMSDLNELCAHRGWTVLIKLHPLSSVKESDLEKYEYIKICRQSVLDEMKLNLYILLKFSDCLVTDYSSVYFDYLLLNKPIGFTVSDMRAYSHDRGFTVSDPEEYMPGEKICKGEDFIYFAHTVFAGKERFEKERIEMCKLFNMYTDDGNCRRILEVSGITK